MFNYGRVGSGESWRGGDCGFFGGTTAEFELLYQVKEKICRVRELESGQVESNKSGKKEREEGDSSSRNDDKNKNTITNTNTNTTPTTPASSYLLPDGTPLTLPQHSTTSPLEIFFSPLLLGSESSPIPSLLTSSITSCDLSLRRTLFDNVVLAGGSSVAFGMPERLLKEVRALAPEYARVRILAPEGREGSDWAGGSILASLSTFRDVWVSKSMYEEEGERIRKWASRIKQKR